MEQNSLLLPRGYLSSSQLDCWLSSKERYRREYFERSSKLDTKYLRFGSAIAKMIEEDRHKELLPDLVVYKNREYVVQCNVGIVPVYCKIDHYDEELHDFRDDKTGKTPWTQQKLQKTNQFLFYATALKHKTGKMPERCYVDWIETIDKEEESNGPFSNNAEIQVTGRIVTLCREFDQREIEREEELILKVAEEISEAYRDFIKEI